MNLFEYITDRKQQLHSRINLIVEHEHSVSKVAYLSDALHKLQIFMQEGKMIRGVLVIMAAETFGEKISENLLHAAASMEFLHSSFLIHDDIMDNDTLRRGKPTIFAQYQQEAEEQNIPDSQFYGQAMAICAGNIAQALAYNSLAHASSNSATQTQLMEKFSAEVGRVNGGQMQDFHYGASNEDPSPEKILHMYRYKAARYTFSLPLVLGALTAGANDKTIEMLDELGEYLGLVFQIKDDEIELYSTEEEIGKPVGSDIRENKKTYVRSLLFSKVNEQEKEKLQRIFGNKALVDEDLRFVKQLIRKYGVDTEVHNLMNDFSQKAQEIVKKLDGNKQYLKTLEELIEYNLHRTS